MNAQSKMGKLRSKMSNEASCERVIRKLYRPLELQLCVLADFSETLKRKHMSLSRNKGYTEIACIFCRPLSSKKCLV